jgi:hypothetical protein
MRYPGKLGIFFKFLKGVTKLVSREKIARLIEGPSFVGAVKDVNKSMDTMTRELEETLLSLLSGERLDKGKLDKSLADLKSSLGTLKVRTDESVGFFEKDEIKGIEDLRTKIFPGIVEYDVIQLLKVRAPEDIAIVTGILDQLREKGVAAVWERILPSLTAHTKKVCGLLFPSEYIEEGKTLPLDIEYLSSFVAKEIAALTVASPAAAGGAGGRKPASEASYMPGLRRGFLSGPKPPQKPKDHDADAPPAPGFN